MHIVMYQKEELSLNLLISLDVFFRIRKRLIFLDIFLKKKKFKDMLNDLSGHQRSHTAGTERQQLL